ncbi:NemA protein [Neisseria chenwenguii]|uniref:NemA protein n=1 Tax=Neisseria chenwenguii TaxID=1853278 RepID=UPI000F4E4586|nr:NemA protein [Neisseria chenwenguii]ROV56441.1 NemA protein [Neisseria chenwenguii]
MKTVLATTLLTLTLCACSNGTPGMSVGIGLGTGIGSHLGLSTSLNIPIGLNKNRAQNSDGLKIIEEQIVTHFDTHGNATDSAVKGGFYRQLISKRGSSYLVQDFYSDGKKRTDPYTLPRNKLLQFRAMPDNGSLTVYAYNGTVMQQQVFQSGKLVSARP